VLTDRLILRGADGYDEARFAHIFNVRRPERHPAAVLLAESEDDVVDGVRIARERGWKVAIRAGGHSFPAWSLRDDALVIDLGGFKKIALDESTGVVSVTPSVSSGELNAYLSDYGRFFGSAECPSVGLGGFLLQGGFGLGFRGWGYAAEQIVAVDVVTADGQLIRADEQSHSDLFWAARGAGPGYCGAITRFHLRTRPELEGLASTTQIYPLELYSDVLEWAWGLHHRMSPDVALVPLAVIPPFPVPGGSDGFTFTIGALALSASRDQALEVLAPLAESPFIDDALVVQHAQPITVAERLEFAAAIHPHGMRYLVDSAWLDGPPRDCIAAAKQVVTERPSGTRGHAFFDFALPRNDAPDMAMSLRGEVMLGSYIIYDGKQNDQAYRAWHADAFEPLQPFTIGAYWGDSDQTQREVKTLTDDAWARLKQIRAERDPSGVFVDYLAGPGGFRNRNGWETN
jgi:FAD/FMN-containing dehydrogenase